MELFFAQLLNGAALGALYALFGIGFGLVFATLGILNAAQGCYASFAAITALYAVDWAGLPFWLGLPVGLLAAACIAILVDQIGFQPLRNRGGGMLGALITSIAFWIMLDSLAGFATGQQSLAFPPGTTPGGIYHIGPLLLPQIQLLTIVALIVVAVSMHWLIAHTGFGAAMRAVGYDPVAASLGGLDSRLVVIATAGMSGAISGLAGVLGGVATANVAATLGQGLMLKGFAAVVVGGYDDVRGTAIAGVALGIAEVFCAQYLSTSLRDGITYALLLGFLMVRPRGLFGRAGFVRP